MSPCPRMGVHRTSHDYARAKALDVTEAIFESIAGDGGLFRGQRSRALVSSPVVSWVGVLGEPSP